MEDNKNNAAPAPGPGTSPFGNPTPGEFTSPFGTPNSGAGDSFELDLTDDSVLNGDMVPAGKYYGKVIDVSKGFSKSGNPMWTWTFVIVGGDHAGKEFKLFTAITPSAMWKVAETLAALGLGGGGQVSRFGRADVINRMAVLELEEDEYDGRKRTSIKTIYAHPEGAGKKWVDPTIPTMGM